MNVQGNPDQINKAVNEKNTAGDFSWFWTNFAGNTEDLMDYDELQRPFIYLVCKL